MKKILALIMALAMVLSLAACGGNGDKDETTTAPAGETVANAEGTEAAPVDGTEAATGDTTDVSADASTEADASAEDPANNDAPAATGELTKAQFVAFLNAETAKIAKSGSYTLNRNCTYIRNLDVGDATDRLNDFIKGIDKNSDLNSVVGGFIGIGTTTGNIPKNKADVDSDYLIKATTLKESDLANFSANNGVYTFTLANAKNPKKTGATPISRFTNDFITHQEVVDSIKDITPLIKVDSSTVDYTNIKVSVTVKDGKITTINYSYAFDAALTIKLIVTINGDGAAKTATTYSNIKY